MNLFGQKIADEAMKHIGKKGAEFWQWCLEKGMPQTLAGKAWCAMFVSRAVYLASDGAVRICEGMKGPGVFPSFGSTFVPSVEKWARATGRLVSWGEQAVGDLVLVAIGGKEHATHIGVVTSVPYPEIAVCFEGNYGRKVSRVKRRAADKKERVVGFVQMESLRARPKDPIASEAPILDFSIEKVAIEEGTRFLALVDVELEPTLCTAVGCATDGLLLLQPIYEDGTPRPDLEADAYPILEVLPAQKSDTPPTEDAPAPSEPAGTVLVVTDPVEGIRAATEHYAPALAPTAAPTEDDTANAAEAPLAPAASE